ncbi:hypothetical protein P879_06588 [Paragonimus westermani]|uniref:Uncharacterized protein n=1 Tax=Paragonimus westermani TaxID=34504 RepID=A0A8T0DLQ2_9TREM|nr:hypothetical protein P879_06588 [Paragonimus westermani]
MATAEQKSIEVSRPNGFSAQRHPPYVGSSNGPVPPDTPWRRGDVIHSRSGLSSPNDLGNANRHPQLFHCFQRPNRGRSQWYRGRRKPSNFAYITGLHAARSPRSPRGSPNSQGMRSRWNMSMPQGLQNCDISYYPPGYVDDGFIDDSLLTDLSQYSLQGMVKSDRSEMYPNELYSTLSVQRFQFNEDCMSTPHLPDTYGVSKNSHPEYDSALITQAKDLQKGVISSTISLHEAQSVGKLAKVLVVEASPAEDILDITSNSDYKNACPPTDYLTMVWGKSSAPRSSM